MQFFIKKIEFKMFKFMIFKVFLLYFIDFSTLNRSDAYKIKNVD